MAKSWIKNRSELQNGITKVIGLDLAASKICATYDNSNTGNVETKIFPNIILEGSDNIDDNDSTVSEFTVDGKTYTVGRQQDSRVRSNLLTTGTARLTNPHVRAVLAQYALTQLGFGGENVFVIASMPTSNYFLHNGKRNSQLIKKSMEALAYPVHINNKAPAIVNYLNNKGKTIYGIPQSEAGAAFRAAFTNTRMKDIRTIKRGDIVDITDIGFGTTDIARISLNGDLLPVIHPEHSSSIQWAMQPIMSKFNEATMEVLQSHKDEWIRDTQLSQAQHYQAWLDGNILIGTKTLIDLSSQKKKAIDEGMNQLLAEIKSQNIATGVQVRYHLASGGGAIQAKDQLQSKSWYNGEMEIIDNPAEACSIGNFIEGQKQMLHIAKKISGDNDFSIDDLREVTYG